MKDSFRRLEVCFPHNHLRVEILPNHANALGSGLSLPISEEEPTRSTGLSMHRFMNRLVVLAAGFVLLTGSQTPLLAQADWIKEALGSKNKPKSRSARPDPAIAFAAQYVLVSRATVRNVEQAITRYRRMAETAPWRPIPKGPVLKLGDDGSRVKLLVRRLAISGDLPIEQARRASDHFDDAVKLATQRFQLRNGLTPSGRVNSYTRSALNVSAKRRLDQLIQNRQRLLDLLARTEGTRYVLVNIPSYELQAVSQGRLEIYSRVVLGKPLTPTPVISAKIRALNTLPYWHVPQSIARRQLIPALKKDPNYLVKQRIRVFASWGGAEIDPRAVNWWAPQGQRYVFRQEPGPQNALGLLRLDMPNKHIVYMHDTPLKPLFDYHLRPYSAGCVRVQTVFDVGEWLLRGDQNAATGQLGPLIQQRRKETIKLREPVDVHFVYISAWAGRSGITHFRPDIYRKDGQIVHTSMLGGWQTQTTSAMP
jgi:L,D-transpeptidase YcbB